MSLLDPSHNAVLRLRQHLLDNATRPFLARGCRVKRCQRCLLSLKHCACESIKAMSANSKFCLIMFGSEPYKPSNTGRLIADILPDTEAFLWSRTEVDPALLALLNDERYQGYVVFPESYADESRTVVNTLPAAALDNIQNKKPLFILLDGTWAEARKMFRKSPYLNHLPIFSVDVTAASHYQLREASREEQHCTAEVAIALLDDANDKAAAAALSAHFEHVRQCYLAGKSFHPRADKGGNEAQSSL